MVLPVTASSPDSTTTSSRPKPTVAVVGAGVAGLTAAYLLRHDYDVTVLEAEPRLGGHAHTHDVRGREGGSVGVDSGFIVHNTRTYPLLRRLFDELGVATQPTEMSMSVHCGGCGLEYAGGRGRAGLFAQGARSLRPKYLGFLTEIVRFNRAAKHFLAESAPDDLTTLGQFVADRGFSRYVVRHYVVAFVSCVWSAGHGSALDYPARYLFTFLDHHGLLEVRAKDEWLTVTGGSRSYVDALASNLSDVRTGAPVRAITRKPHGVEIQDDADEMHQFERVVIATHADQALALITDASDTERDVLGAFRYTTNETWLHTDASVLPDARGARASWNYLLRDCDADEDSVLVSYWMNHLQHLDADDDYLVTLNAFDGVRDDAVLARMSYTHPVYTPASVAAQSRLAALATDSTVFAGAYHGWGFHEDGCRAGVAAAAHFGVAW